MTSISGIPTTRVSDLFVRQRVLAQVQYDLRELFRLENQLSTGHQFELPSDEPVASLRIEKYRAPERSSSRFSRADLASAPSPRSDA